MSKPSRGRAAQPNPEPEIPADLVSVKQAATEYPIPERTLRDRILTRALPSYRFGRRVYLSRRDLAAAIVRRDPLTDARGHLRAVIGGAR